MKQASIKITFFSLLALVVISILITSCEQEAIISPTDSETINDMEGFKSTTGNTDAPLIINEDEVLEPIFRMSFSSDLTKEEAEAEWSQAVENYMRSINNTELEDRGFSTEWFFRVATITGSQTYNGTDGRVYSRATFNTSKGYYRTPYYRMDTPDDNFEEEKWDFFLFRTYIPYEAVEWVEAKHADLALNGTDGWFIKFYGVYVGRDSQSIPASGSTYIYSQPNVWLDSPSSNNYDFYNTGWIGTGRLEF